LKKKMRKAGKEFLTNENIPTTRPLNTICS